MMFGDTTLVPYKNGLSKPENTSEGRDYPDFEYCITAIHMKSKLVSAITNHSIASTKFINGSPEKGERKYFESREYFESLFDFEESTSKQIRVEIDTDSLSDDLYCLSNFDGEMLAVKPKSIHLILKESNPENAREKIVGYCYFDDKREKKEYSIKEGSDSLEIFLPVNSDVFSSIFMGIKGGDNTIYASIYFPAYADTLDRMSGLIAPSTCVIDASYMGDNFAVLDNVSLLAQDISIESDESEGVEVEQHEPRADNSTNEKLDEISYKIGNLDLNTHNSTALLTSINSSLKIVSFLLILLVALFLFKFVW